MEAESTTAFLAEFMDVFLAEVSELNMILSTFSVSSKKLLSNRVDSLPSLWIFSLRKVVS